MAASPGRVVDHFPNECAGCGTPLGPGAATGRFEQRQVFDIPPIRPEGVEHRLHRATCPGCGKTAKTDPPAGASRQVQYGPNLLAFAVYLHSYQRLPLKRAAELLGDLLGCPVSPATVEKAVEAAARRVQDGFAPLAKKALAASPGAHADETGMRVAGTLRWVHSFSDKLFTWIQIHRKRGREAVDHIGIVPEFRGVLVHDAWVPYDAYPRVGVHQLCCAHYAEVGTMPVRGVPFLVGSWGMSA
jgi:transposase